jgi:superfamily II DNA helicase RecQ
MGFDAPDTRLVVNVGLPYSDWELKQQSVRGGRDGKQSVTVQLVPHLRVSSRPGAILQYCSTAVLQYYSNTAVQVYSKAV